MADNFSNTSHRKLQDIPAPDLSAMEIRDLWTLADLFERLGETAGFFLTQPRSIGPAGVYIESLWGQHLHGIREAVISEMKARKPQNALEEGMRAETSGNHDQVAA
jgi:hypothetical protein